MSAEEWLTLRTLALWAAQDATLAAYVADFPWLSDDITIDEGRAVHDLRDIAAEHPSLLRTLLSLPWTSDQITPHETRVINILRDLARADATLVGRIAQTDYLSGPIQEHHVDDLYYLHLLSSTDSSLAASLSTRSWFGGRQSQHAGRVIAGLRRIASTHPGAVRALREMPFLNHLQPADAVTIDTLKQLASHSSVRFNSLMSHPNIKDGITDDEAKLVTALGCADQDSLDTVDKLLDPNTVTLEKRTISLPLTGYVELTIVRTSRGSKHTMDLLASAIRTVENFMGLPFPERAVIVLFDEALASYAEGHNCERRGVVVKPTYDFGRYRRTIQVLAHEVSHYYWLDSSPWIVEGAADFLAAIAANTEFHRPLAPRHPPCTAFQSIAELEREGTWENYEALGCHYSLGERIFHDLYRGLDDTAFRLAFRRLHLLSEFDNPDDACRGTNLNICHLRAAFTEDLTTNETRSIEYAIDRWYHGE